MTQCKYKRIGCPWHGPFHELTVHEAACAHPTKTGNELMEILDEMDQSHRKEMQLYNSIFSLLSFEKIGYTGEAPCCLLHPTRAGAGPAARSRGRCTRWPGSERAPGAWEDASGKRAGGRARGPGRTLGAPAWLCRDPSPWGPHPSPVTPTTWCPHCRGLHGLGPVEFHWKVGVSGGLQELRACPAEPGARRAVITSGPAERQLLQ